MNSEMKLSSTENFLVKKRKLEVENDLPTSQHRNVKSKNEIIDLITELNKSTSRANITLNTGNVTHTK